MKRLAVGILAHVDAGKTTLSEAMLYAGGMIRHLGRVDKGDAFLNWRKSAESRFFPSRRGLHGMIWM